MSIKILYIGSVLFSAKALEKLVSMNANLVGVITKKESKFNSDFYDLSCIAEKNGIPWIYAKNINDTEVVKFIREKKPDVIYCFGWSQLLKKEILNIPRIGVIGFHPTKLPQNRGRHPLIWALFLGLKETASTFFFMDEGTDSGDILSQEIVEIKYEDDAQSLYNKICEVASKQIETFTVELERGTFKRIPQDHSKANYWRIRSKIDGLIDFRMTSRAIYNLVRALTKPYPGAEVLYKNKAYKVWKVKEEVVNLPNIEPGKVLKVNGRKILVKCYENAVWLLEHEIDEVPKEGDYVL
ncbi:formyltransferase family protein [Desulfurobacterium crinifex]